MEEDTGKTHGAYKFTDSEHRMKCKYCGKEIVKFEDFSTRNKCAECARKYMREYMKEYRKTEKYKKYHREYWHGGPILEGARTEW